MPLFDAMEKYRGDSVYPLHTPGHKGGRGAAKELKELLGSKSLPYDVSLMSELDDLHEPSGCLKEAQEKAAVLYGADASFFAVNGTTGAIHAMLLAATRPGDKVLVPRNAHRSVFGGLFLGRLEPVYLLPDYDEDWQLSLQVTAEEIEQELKRTPGVSAVLITSPNYYGLAADVEAIAAVCHQRGIPLLVDEAHGAHLGFHESFPPCALMSGADLVAQSTHKLLGALTQCSMLHVKSKFVSVEKVAQTMSMLTTTSPNYFLLASLDIARAQLAEDGRTMLQDALDAATLFRGHLEQIAGIKVLQNELVGKGGVVACDPTKLVIKVSGLGVTGMEAAAALRAAGIAVELADRENILLLLTYADKKIVTVVKKLADTLTKLASEGREPLPKLNMRMPRPLAGISMEKAFYARSVPMDFDISAGEICAEQIVFYPPGIPAVLPGERLTAPLIDYCRRMVEAGVPVTGVADAGLKTVRVVKR